MLLSLHMIGSNCWTRKNGARTLTAKSLSKSSTVVSSMVADFEIPAFATRMSNRSPTTARTCLASLWAPVRRRKIGGNGVRTSAGLADLGDDGFRLFHAAAVVDENLRAHSGESQRASPAHSARGAGHEGGLS